MKHIFLIILISLCAPIFASELRLTYTTQEQLEQAVASYKGDVADVDILVLELKEKRTSNQTAMNELPLIDYSALVKFPNVKSLQYVLTWYVSEYNLFLYSVKNKNIDSFFETQLHSLETIPDFPALETIVLANDHLTGWGNPARNFMGDYLNLLARFSNVKSIDLSGNPSLVCAYIEGYDFSVLSHLENLEELNLSKSTPANGEVHAKKVGHLQGIETLTHLKKLILRDTAFFHTELDMLSSLESLEELDVVMSYGFNPSKHSPPFLKRLHINLFYYGLEWFDKVPNLEELELSLFNTMSTNWDLREFNKLPLLKKLSIDPIHMNSSQIEQAEYTSLPSLEELTLNGSKTKGFSFSTFAPNMKKLSLHGANLTNGDAVQIALLANLEELDLGSTSMNGIMLKKLGNLEGLKNLNLSELDLSQADFTSLQSMENLDISNCTLSLKSFETLKQLHNLKSLNLKGQKNRNISPTEIQGLQEALPACEILK